LLEAVEALADVRSPAAILTLIEVLSFNNPGAAVAAVDGLVQMGEPAVVPLLELMDGYNYTARSWAVRALAGIGDPRGLDTLLKAVTDFSFSVRRSAARGLGAIRWDWMPAADRPAAQWRSREALQQCVDDEEWVVRYAAVVGLQMLAETIIQEGESADTSSLPSILSTLKEHFASESEPAVRMRILLAQDSLGGNRRLRNGTYAIGMAQ
jgi:phycocyanobilin lyase beta subunit